VTLLDDLEHKGYVTRQRHPATAAFLVHPPTPAAPPSWRPYGSWMSSNAFSGTLTPPNADSLRSADAALRTASSGRVTPEPEDLRAATWTTDSAISRRSRRSGTSAYVSNVHPFWALSTASALANPTSRDIVGSAKLAPAVRMLPGTRSSVSCGGGVQSLVRAACLEAQPATAGSWSQ